jgi:hypothetical protein
MGAEVEKRLLVRFAPPTALRERRVMPREVSIVFIGDNNDSDYGEKVWDMGKNSERYECLRIQTPNQLRRCSAQLDHDRVVTVLYWIA